MAERRLMKYNPAFLSDEELIDTFAVRERELESILEVLRENTGRSNQHVLVIGPRGIGKTTLVRRAAAEVRRDAELKERWYPLIYAEESYRVSTPGEFWLEGILHLAEQTKEPSWRRSYEELLQERDEQRLCEKALSRLLDFADGQGKRILLIVENLNMLFQDQMDEQAGWVLRQTLQHEKRIMLLGTASRRFDEIKGIDRAWFEMFKILEPAPLSTSECRKMWKKITGQTLLHKKARVLRILTGGNPRLLAIVIQFAEKMSLTELMDDLVRLVDEHTEYFKSHLDGLPGGERKVFASLAEIWDPATAGEVAEAARLEVNKTSAFLKRLMERGAVETVVLSGKRNRYQLAERMYNIYYLMRCRGSSSSRVQAAVRFMISFYSLDEIGQVITALGKEACGLTAERRGEFYQMYECLLEMMKSDDGIENIIKATPKEFFELPDMPEQIREMGLSFQKDQKKKSTLNKLKEIIVSIKNKDFKKVAEISSKLHDEDLPNLAEAWAIRGFAYKIADKYKDAEVAYRKAIEIEPNSDFAWQSLGLMYHRNLERYQEAENAYRKAVEINPNSDLGWQELGKLLDFKLSKYQEAEEAYRTAIKINPNNGEYWVMLGSLLYMRLKRYKEAEEAYRKAIEIMPKETAIRIVLIVLLLEEKKITEAFIEAEEALDILARAVAFMNAMAEIFGLGGDTKEYITQAEKWSREAVEKEPGVAKYKFTLAIILGRKGAWIEALGVMKEVMEDAELVKSKTEIMIEFYINAAAAGYAEESLKVLQGSASADQLEPLAAGLEQYITRRVGMRAKEIEEIAKDVVKKIEERRKKIKQGEENDLQIRLKFEFEV